MIVFSEPVEVLGLKVSEMVLLTDHMAQLKTDEGKISHVGIKNQPNLYSPLINQLKKTGQKAELIG